MSLNSTNFVVKGPIKSVDMKQFVDLFTGVMLDQPVTFKNAVMIGGAQGSSTPPLKLFGVTGQTGNLIELYPTSGSSTATFGFGAVGNFAWGPGSPAANDTFLSRVALQNGHVTDTAGILISPYLEVQGNIRADGFTFTNQATLTGPAANPFRLVVNQDLYVNRNLNVTGTVQTGGFVGIACPPRASVGLVLDGTTPINAVAGSAIGFQGAPALTAQVNGDNLWAMWLRGVNFNLNAKTGVIAYTLAVDPPTGAAVNLGIRVTGGAPAIQVDAGGIVVAGGSITVSTAAVVAQNFVASAVGQGLSGTYPGAVTGPLVCTTGDSGGYSSFYCGPAGLLFVNSANTTRIGSLSNAGNLNVNGTLSAGAITPGAPGDIGASRGGGIGVLYLADAAHYLISNGGIFTLAGGPLIVSGTVTASGFLANADGQGLTVIDGNTRIISSARAWYFDQYAGGWLFRNSAAGLAAVFSIDAAGNTTLSGSLASTGSVVVYGNGLTTGSTLCLESSKAVKLFYDSSVAAVNIPYGNGVQSPYFRAQSGFVAQNGNAALGLESGYNISCYGSALGTWVARSDRRLKENLVSIPDSACLAQIVDTTMPVYSFAWKDDETAAPQSGFVADEVYDEVPVYANVDEEGFPNAINYSQMVPTLWSAVRELAARIEKLEVA